MQKAFLLPVLFFYSFSLPLLFLNGLPKVFLPTLYRILFRKRVARILFHWKLYKKLRKKHSSSFFCEVCNTRKFMCFSLFTWTSIQSIQKSTWNSQKLVKKLARRWQKGQKERNKLTSKKSEEIENKRCSKEEIDWCTRWK